LIKELSGSITRALSQLVDHEWMEWSRRLRYPNR
jgi:hypothetical protein